MKAILKLFTGFGVFLLIGTAGASDVNLIPVNQIIRQLLISLFIISSGLTALKLKSLKEEKKKRNKLLKKMYADDRIDLTELNLFS